MVESPDVSPKNSTESLTVRKTTSSESLKSLEEKAMNEMSEKETKTEDVKKEEEIHATTLASLNAKNNALKIATPVQKTEIVLRLHPMMQEAACQTDETTDAHDNSLNIWNGDLETPPISILKKTSAKRQKHPEELDFENLSKDLASQLSPSDKLHSILGEFCASLFILIM